ncbi:unnamed protein product, partial [Cylicostephanus goldi]
MDQQIRVAVVGVTWISLAAYSLAANVLLAFLICKSNDMRRYTSYWIIISVSLCDAGITIINLCYFIPSVLTHDAPSTNEVTFDFYNWIWDLFWYTGVVHIALMAMNRFVCIVYPSYYAVFFSRTRTLLILCIIYIVGFTINFPTLFP